MPQTTLVALATTYRRIMKACLGMSLINLALPLLMKQVDYVNEHGGKIEAKRECGIGSFLLKFP